MGQVVDAIDVLRIVGQSDGSLLDCIFIFADEEITKGQIVASDVVSRIFLNPLFVDRDGLRVVFFEETEVVREYVVAFVIAGAVFELERLLEVGESSLFVPDVALRRRQLGPGHGEIRIEFDSVLIVRQRPLLIVLSKCRMTQAEFPKRIERGGRGLLQRCRQFLR